jgi:hypothetical protein
MDVFDVPFVNHVKIQRNSKENLYLDFSEHLLNHVGSLNASAQFTLAETASGNHIISKFNSDMEKWLVLLRTGNIKYKAQAITTIEAVAEVSEKSNKLFQEQIKRKSKGLLDVKVVLKDENGVEISVAMFRWYIEKRG